MCSLQRLASISFVIFHHKQHQETSSKTHHITSTSFNTCLQLINELGAVDARLAPEFRQLLAGGEKTEATSKQAEGRKSKVSHRKEKVREAH